MCVTDVRLQRAIRCEVRTVTIAAAANHDIPMSPNRVGIIFPGRMGTGESISLVLMDDNTNQFARLSSLAEPLLLTMKDCGDLLTKSWRIRNLGAASITLSYADMWLPSWVTNADINKEIQQAKQ